jgi:pyruvate/2-oxoglutarate dehydrogenase complex dihydrolipoamide dehydrogenase (E3) component
MIGANVTELICEPSNVIHLGGMIDSIANTVHPHSSLS